MSWLWIPVAAIFAALAACGSGSPTSIPACNAASDLQISSSVEGSLAAGDDRFDGAFIDYYRVRLSASQQITVTQSSSAFDPLLLVFDSEGNVVSQAFDQTGSPPGETETATLTRAFGAGCFLLGASVWDRGDTGTYTLSVLEAGEL